MVAFIMVILASCGSSPAAPSPTVTLPPLSGADWTMYHGDLARTGYVADFPDPHRLALAWDVHLDGAVYAQPLVVGDRVIVATEGDSLYALDTRTGHMLWQAHVGTPVLRSDLPCGNIAPLGITGTPVYDPATDLIFAVAEVSGPSHILVGVDLQTGAVRQQRPIDPPTMVPVAQQQRAALALSGGYVTVAFGGLLGDCGPYHGWLVRAPTDGTGALRDYQIPTTREGGIWGASGPAIDALGRIFVSVGNGEAVEGAWDQSDSVLRFTPDLTYDDGFAPTTWAQENATDLDLGSMGAVLLPGGFILAAGKSGRGYLLSADHLGGIGGEIQEIALCRAFGGAATVGSRAFLPCTDGDREVVLDAHGPSLSLGWRAPANISGSPVVGGQTVYSLDAGTGTLYALNLVNGAVRASLTLDPVTRFATPALYGGAIFVGTTLGIEAVGVELS